jgi:hypothetical protein
VSLLARRALAEFLGGDLLVAGVIDTGSMPRARKDPST